MNRYVVMMFAAFASGCSLAPPFEHPTVDTPAQFKELPEAERGQWKVAQPAEALPRGEWWKVFGDPALDGLEANATAANQSLTAAAARVAEARALVGVAKADRIPQVNYGLGVTREKPTGA